MKMDHFQWRTFAFDLIPQALFGYAPQSSIGSSYIHNNDLKDKNIAMGYIERFPDSSYNPPVIIIVGDNDAAEILSWLRVYAPETSPLSQFARVLSISDWDAFQENSFRKNSKNQRQDHWACIILGEVLAQGEGDVELHALPLSRAAACFSTAMARTSITFGHDHAVHTCIDRLIILEADRRFVRRVITIEDLLPIWAIIESQLNESFDIETVAGIVVESARKYAGGSSKSSTRKVLPSLRDYPALTSDSIEDRIVTFKRLASEIMLSFGDAPILNYSSALLAAGAFLVGRGTTHAFLLQPLAKRMPTVFIWFGLMAALSGPRSWDVNWSRATKGVERLLRAEFDWIDPPATDICWIEYSWMSKTFDGVEIFNELPKMFPKVLSIEIIPGTTCQFRLLSEQVSNNYEIEQKLNMEMLQRNEELQITLQQVVSLGMKAKELLDNQRRRNISTQQSLGLRNTEHPYTKNTRLKRSKKNTDF